MRQVDQDVDTLRQQVCKYARLAYDRKLAAGAGSIAVLCCDSTLALTLIDTTSVRRL